MEKRTVSFRELGMIDPGKEQWGPKREMNQQYIRKCRELLDQESQEHPRHRVSMSVDHRLRRVTFEYYPRDFELEEKLAKVGRQLWRLRIAEAKRLWGKGR